MQVVYNRCCGLDVHKKTIVACVLITLGPEEVQRHIRTFSTMTAGLLALSDWLERLQVSVVAMESTGVYTLPPMLPKRCSTGSTQERSCIATFARV
jgi:transposase